jgi:hypothetical protein
MQILLVIGGAVFGYGIRELQWVVAQRRKSGRMA